MEPVRARLRHLLAASLQTGGTTGVFRVAAFPVIIRNLSSSAARGTESADQAQSESGDRIGGRSATDDAASLQAEPWTYYFQEIPPDDTASRLSQATKENMWQLHQQDPKHWTAERCGRRSWDAVCTIVVIVEIQRLLFSTAEVHRKEWTRWSLWE